MCCPCSPVAARRWHRRTCLSWSSTTQRSSDIPALSPLDAEPVARAEVDAFGALLVSLEDSDWSQPTRCTGWDVQDIAAHVTSAAAESARPSVLLQDSAQAVRYIRMGPVNALNHVQVVRGRRQTPQQLIAEFERVGPDAVRSRRDFPQLLRRIPLPLEPLFGSTVGKLMDVLYVRDMFVHRLDITDATGRPLDRSGHVATIISQVVRDLGKVWTARPVTLELTGEGGGTWLVGSGEQGAHVRVDAIDAVRSLAGRDDDPKFDVDGDPAIRSAFRAARVPI